MRSNVLAVEPFNADSSGEQGYVAEIGCVLQLSKPGAGDTGSKDNL